MRNYRRGVVLFSLRVERKYNCKACTDEAAVFLVAERARRFPNQNGRAIPSRSDGALTSQ